MDFYKRQKIKISAIGYKEYWQRISEVNLIQSDIIKKDLKKLNINLTRGKKK